MKGEPLPKSIQKEAEQAHGINFANTRIHTGTKANMHTDWYQANAMTLKNHVLFNQGKYNPSSTEGKSLLRHELTHVAQQSTKNAPIIQRDPQFETSTDVFREGEEEHKDEFTSQELQWIQEAFDIPEMQLVYRLVEKIPPAIIHKVKGFNNNDDPYGLHENGKVIISEKYKETQTEYSGQGWNNEVKFKRLLLHELLHFFDGQLAMEGPGVLKKLLLFPQLAEGLGLKEFELGWFKFPNIWFGFSTCHFNASPTLVEALLSPGSLPSDARLLIPSFQTPVINDAERDEWLWYQSGAYLAYKSGNYEDYADSRNPEEDAADIFSLYLTSMETRQYLESTYPKRYKLVHWFFQKLYLLDQRP